METKERSGSGRRRAARRRPWPMRLLQLVLTATIAVGSLALVGVVFGQMTHRFRLAPVLSGSMSPTIDTGALVLAEPVRTSALEPGDILLFNAPIDGDPLVMHRIYDKQVQHGTSVFTTKGDANDAPDAWAIRIRGQEAWRVRHAVPYVGTVIGWLGRVGARMIVLVGGVSLLLLWGLRAVWGRTPISWHARDPHGVRLDRARRQTNRRSVSLISVGVLGVVALATAGLAGAQFTATPTPPLPAVGSGALGAPTGLNCAWTSTTNLRLNWTDATPTFSTGFRVMRSTTQGSGYTLDGTTVAPTVQYDDLPSPVTTRQYYVTQASRSTWTSANSNEVASNLCLRAINAAAGTGTAGFSGDTGQATAAQLNNPNGLAHDASGNIYIADTTNNRIRKITVATGVITTVAGGGASTGCAFAGAATSATLNLPEDVAVDASGNLYIADTANNCIRRVTPAGAISLYAGTGATTACTYSGAPTGVSLLTPRGINLDASGNLFIADSGRRCIRKVVGATLSQVAGAGAGTASACTFSGAATAVILSTNPAGVAVDASGNVYIADTVSNCIRRVAGTTISQFAGGGASTACTFSGAATAVSLSGPNDVTVDNSGRVVITDNTRRCVRIISGTNVSQLAATGTSGSTGDNGPAVAALMVTPSALTVDDNGHVWVGDLGNDRVRRIEGPT